MRELKQKRIIRRIFFSRVTIVVLVGMLLFLMSATWGVYGKYRETAVNRDNAERALTDLQVREERLTAEIARLGSDRAIEQEIRENFGLAREGEEVIIIVPSDEIEAPPSERSPNGLMSRLWQKLWD